MINLNANQLNPVRINKIRLEKILLEYLKQTDTYSFLIQVD